MHVVLSITFKLLGGKPLGTLGEQFHLYSKMFTSIGELFRFSINLSPVRGNNEFC